MSEYQEYDGYLENKSQSNAQPNGVSEDQNDWGHRSEMAKQGEVQFEEQRSVSQRVDERRNGEIVQMDKKDHGKEGHKASNENDDKLVK
jgi:hypothetical protein